MDIVHWALSKFAGSRNWLGHYLGQRGIGSTDTLWFIHRFYTVAHTVLWHTVVLVLYLRSGFHDCFLSFELGSLKAKFSIPNHFLFKELAIFWPSWQLDMVKWKLSNLVAYYSVNSIHLTSGFWKYFPFSFSSDYSPCHWMPSSGWCELHTMKHLTLVRWCSLLVLAGQMPKPKFQTTNRMHHVELWTKAKLV